MEVKCNRCNGSGLVEQDDPYEPPCLSCGHRKVRLVKREGWYCERCNSGPFTLDINGFVRKGSESHNSE